MSGLDQEVLDLVALQLGAKRVKPADRLADELGAESADLLNLVATLEDRYGCEIDEEEMVRLATVADVQRLMRERLGQRGE